MKKIIAKWYKTKEGSLYPKVMIVEYSNHPIYKEGERFDFGFVQIASEEGYVIEIFPLKDLIYNQL